MSEFDRSNPIATLVRRKRKARGYTQKELSERVGVGYNFIRELERGKPGQRMDLVNQVLHYFGYRLEPVVLPREQSQ